MRVAVGRVANGLSDGVIAAGELLQETTRRAPSICTFLVRPGAT